MRGMRAPLHRAAQVCDTHQNCPIAGSEPLHVSNPTGGIKVPEVSLREAALWFIITQRYQSIHGIATHLHQCSSAAVVHADLNEHGSPITSWSLITRAYQRQIVPRCH